MSTFENVLCDLETPQEQYRTQAVRNFPRAPVAVKVTLQSDQHRWEGITADLGVGGIFIEHGTPLQVGVELAVSLYLPDDLATPVQTTGRVTWIRRERQGRLHAGMGIAFTGISAPARNRLLCLIQSLGKMRFANEFSNKRTSSAPRSAERQGT